MSKVLNIDLLLSDSSISFHIFVITGQSLCGGGISFHIE